MKKLIGKKLGMTQMFDPTGALVPVTVIRVAGNTVIAERTQEKDGYSAIVLAAEDVKPSRLSKPVLGQFKDGMTPKRHIFEVRDFDGEYSLGSDLDVTLFENVEFVDVSGTSKGKGYQGVMKRHGFGGGRKTHGSKFHRANGSTGMAAWPSRVHKGTKMAGRMGGAETTVQNLRVLQLDPQEKTIMVRGAIPGPKDGIVIISVARKKA